MYEVARVLLVKINSKMTSKEFCLADSATTHMTLKDKKYFQNLILYKANVNTISGSSNLIEGSGRAIIMLLNGTRSEERRVGKECHLTCRSRWSPYH